MHWIQVKALINPDFSTALEDGLLAAGALAVTYADAEDQPLYEPERGTTPLWQNTLITGLFEADIDVGEMLATCAQVFAETHSEPMPALNVEILENEDWTRKWIENFKPVKFGDRLWVCPNWCPPPEPDAINLKLDPGLAFGTGTHPTTALCLKWLDAAELQGKRVADYGCGSGILAIAALLLGAEHAIAVDNDPQALLATRSNAEQNGITTSQLDVFLPEVCPPAQVDIMLANILAEPLCFLKTTLCALLKPGGSIVLSGILDSQQQALIEHYSDLIDFAPATIEAGWVRLSGTRRRD